MQFSPEKLTQKSAESLNEATALAREKRHSELSVLHLLSVLAIQNETAASALLADFDGLKDELSERLEKLATLSQSAEPAPSREFVEVLNNSVREMEALGDSYISTEHLLLALLDAQTLKDIFEKFSIKKQEIIKKLNDIRKGMKVENQNPEGTYNVLEKYGQDFTELARTGKLDPVIGRDEEIRRVIQVLARRRKNNPVLIGDPGVGKTAIVEGLAQRIVSGDVPDTLKNKRLIVLEIASMLAGAKYRGEFEERMQALLKEVAQAKGEIILFIDEMHTIMGAGKTDGSLDAANMLKPMLARGQLHMIGATTLDEYRKYVEKDQALERRFQPVFVGEPSVEDTIAILRGLKERYELHHGVRIREDALVAAAELSNRYITDRFLPDKAIDLVDEASSILKTEAESMPAELDSEARKLRRLEIEREALKKDKSAKSKTRLKELEKEIADIKTHHELALKNWQQEKDLLNKQKELSEQIDELRIEQERLERAGEYDKVAEIQYKKIPDLEKQIVSVQKELDVIPEDKRLIREEVTEQDVARVVSRWTGVPITKLVASEVDKLSHLEDALKHHVVGQEQAVSAVARAIRRSRAGLKAHEKPIGSFLFLGPTGVGKTELVRALAEELFDSRDAMVRIDMSEYMERHAVSRLIGAPPGYVGHEEGGQLTEPVRRRPYSVVLFDEIEKAHPDVFNVLLQVLEDGRLTDSQGRTVNFSNTVIIMTSNIGSELLLEAAEKKKQDKEAIDKQVMNALRAHFRPEFLNRIDDIVVFNPLSKEILAEIVDIQLKQVAQTLKNERDISVEFDKSVKDMLIEKGYDPAFGARPLKRAIQTQVLDELAMELIENKIDDGDHIKLSIKKDKLVVEKK